MTLLGWWRDRPPPPGRRRDRQLSGRQRGRLKGRNRRQSCTDNRWQDRAGSRSSRALYCAVKAMRFDRGIVEFAVLIGADLRKGSKAGGGSAASGAGVKCEEYGGKEGSVTIGITRYVLECTKIFALNFFYVFPTWEPALHGRLASGSTQDVLMQGGNSENRKSGIWGSDYCLHFYLSMRVACQLRSKPDKIANT